MATPIGPHTENLTDPPSHDDVIRRKDYRLAKVTEDNLYRLSILMKKKSFDADIGGAYYLPEALEVKKK